MTRVNHEDAIRAQKLQQIAAFMLWSEFPQQQHADKGFHPSYNDKTLQK